MVLLLAAAGRAAACRDYPTAVATYRKAAYLDPAGVEAHVQLAFTLEASGDLPAATRAFGVALQLARAAGDCLPPGILEGYTAAAFMRLLEQRADVTQQQQDDPQ